MFAGFDYLAIGCCGGWRRLRHTPVLGADAGNCSDAFVMRDKGAWLMWYTQMQDEKIYLAESPDGLQWDIYTIGKNHPFTSLGGERGGVLPSRPDLGWAVSLFSPYVVKTDAGYHLWFSANGKWNGEEAVVIGHAVSPDGREWTMEEEPALTPDLPFEENCVSYPCVVARPGGKGFQMWYTAGGRDTPSCIACAESTDGKTWIKSKKAALLPEERVERCGVGACDVLYRGDRYEMAYTAWEDPGKSRICICSSQTGSPPWKREPLNPVVTGGIAGCWDVDAVGIPRLAAEQGQLRLYYTGQRGNQFSCGVVVRAEGTERREERP